VAEVAEAPAKVPAAVESRTGRAETSVPSSSSSSWAAEIGLRWVPVVAGEDGALAVAGPTPAYGTGEDTLKTLCARALEATEEGVEENNDLEDLDDTAPCGGGQYLGPLKQSGDDEYSFS
jgi:hypothetical protein